MSQIKIFWITASREEKHTLFTSPSCHTNQHWLIGSTNTLIDPQVHTSGLNGNGVKVTFDPVRLKRRFLSACATHRLCFPSDVSRPPASKQRLNPERATPCEAGAAGGVCTDRLNVSKKQLQTNHLRFVCGLFELESVYCFTNAKSPFVKYKNFIFVKNMRLQEESRGRVTVNKSLLFTFKATHLIVGTTRFVRWVFSDESQNY